MHTPRTKNTDFRNSYICLKGVEQIMQDPDHLWEGDVNEAVVEEWVAETTPFERVRHVLHATTEPEYANRLADRARVSEPTARKHLDILAEAGIADTTTTGRGTQYKRSRQTVAMQRIRDLHAQLSRAELADGIRALRDRVRSYQDDHGATDADDLALQFASVNDAEWGVVAEWRALERDLDVAQAALALYDFTPDSDDGSDPSTDNREAHGAFVRGSESGASV